MVKLPPELICIILSYVDVETLRNFRLSCIRLARDTRHLLCKNINVTETPESFLRLLELCRQDSEIARAVHSLTYIPFTLPRLDRVRWDANRRNSSGWLASFDMYKGLLEDRAELARNAENITYLVKALRYIKPKVIDIFDMQDDSCGDPRSHKLLCRVFDRIPYCIEWYSHWRCVDRSYHQSRLYERERFNNRLQHAVATRSFMAVLTALDQSDLSLCELKAKTGLMMLMSPSIETFGRAIQKLRKLDLTIILQPLVETNLSQLSLTHNWDVSKSPETYHHIPLSSYFPERIRPGAWTLGKFL